MDIDGKTLCILGGAGFLLLLVFAFVSELMENRNESKRLDLRKREIDELTRPD